MTTIKVFLVNLPIYIKGQKVKITGHVDHTYPPTIVSAHISPDDHKPLTLIYRLITKPSDFPYEVHPNYKVTPHIMMVDHDPCCDGSYGHIHLLSVKGDLDEPYTALMSDERYEDVKIKFCPFCGAPIKLVSEEEWDQGMTTPQVKRYFEEKERLRGGE